MEPGKIRLKTFLISIAAIIFIEAGMAVTVSKSHLNPAVMLGSVRLIQMMMIILIIMTMENGLSTIGLAPGTIIRGFKKGLIWSGLFGLLTLLAAIVLFLSGINPLALIHSPVPAEHGGIILYFLVSCIVGPVTEEFFFRGILYGFSGDGECQQR